MGKANSDPTEHSFGKRRTMCGANYWTSVQNFMVSNRLAQRLHLLKLVGFFPGDVQADLDRAKAEEKEDDEVILAQLARELADDQPDPPTDELLLANSVGNYAGYLARKVQANSSVAECCKQELAQQEEMKITVELERGDPPSVMFDALVELVDRGELETGRAVLKRPSLPMAHMASFGMSLWDSLMCREDKKERRLRFLSLAMRHRDGFRHLLEFLAASDPTLQGYRCQEGHNLANTILPHISRSLFNCFGANFSKDVTSEARKNKALKQPTDRKRSSIEEGRKETARNRDVYKSRKLTGAHKS
ncbi:uncharacterized protein LOC126990095 [Eriocheir sinensis]|uniref:uncharacterized protein LOC126990095 n=1 Tax=Eriocheir sinensis TaxID=95602 RepID=UPI0021C92CE6|nr:uncharacterized protein LOC126990095 [Eriocheir sinensis]